MFCAVCLVSVAIGRPQSIPLRCVLENDDRPDTVKCNIFQQFYQQCQFCSFEREEVPCRLWMKMWGTCGVKRSWPVLIYCRTIFLEGQKNQATAESRQCRSRFEPGTLRIWSRSHKGVRSVYLAFGLQLISFWKMCFRLNVLFFLLPLL